MVVGKRYNESGEGIVITQDRILDRSLYTGFLLLLILRERVKGVDVLSSRWRF